METKIFDYGMNGEGVTKIDGKIVLVDNALIGEFVDIEIVEDKGNFAYGKVKNMVESSKERTQSKCPYFYDCGGCQLQHMSYNEQLKFKKLLVQKTLKKVANIDVDVTDTVGCENIFNYRNKMSFTINQTNCGLLKLNTKDIVKMDFCPLASNNINLAFKLFKDYIAKNPNENIKNLVIRDINNQMLVGVVTSKHIDLKEFYTILSANFAKIGLYEIINTRKDSVVLSGKATHIAGLKEIEITNSISTNDLNYSVDLLGFHQTNLEIQNKLYEKVLNYMGANSIVINGFSGQGLLSAILATKANQVIGIEINKSSHISAEELKKKNNIKNLTNILGDFNKHISILKNNADTIILDPTKKGCGKIVMNKIKGIKNIVYISCNPIALSKDLNEIKNEYEIEQVIPFDMFPNTTSVETLVKLKNKESI